MFVLFPLLLRVVVGFFCHGLGRYYRGAAFDARAMHGDGLLHTRRRPKVWGKLHPVVMRRTTMLVRRWGLVALRRVEESPPPEGGL